MVGWTLLKTAQHHNLPVNGCNADTPWDYYTFGEGPSSVEDHVIVSQEYFEQTLPMGYQEKDLLEMTERFPTPTCAADSQPRPPQISAPPRLHAAVWRAAANPSVHTQVAAGGVHHADQGDGRHHGHRARHQPGSDQL